MRRKFSKDELIREQMSQLESMHLFLTNLRIAQKNEDHKQVEVNDKAISYTMDRCDELGVTFKLQNKVLYTAQQGKPFSSIRSEIQKELNENYMNIRSRQQINISEMER